MLAKKEGKALVLEGEGRGEGREGEGYREHIVEELGNVKGLF